MGIHLIAIDLDGTLLDSGKRISPRTLDVLASVRRLGSIHVVLASARPPRTTMPYYDQLALDAPMINYNGALVIDPPSSRVIMHSPIPPEVAKQLVALARTLYPAVLVSAEVMDRWYTDRVDGDFLTETAKVVQPDLIAPVEEWLIEPITKLLLLGDPSQLDNIEQVIRRDLANQVAMVKTEPHLLQIMHVTVSKAQALRVVAAELGVTREQVLAIGDNANDVGMLQWAGIAVAIADSHPAALAAADYVTGSNDEDGAAIAIQRIVIEGWSPK